jgi:hypothetical protein
MVTVRSAMISFISRDAQNKKIKLAVNDFRKPGYGGPLSNAASEFSEEEMNLWE